MNLMEYDLDSGAHSTYSLHYHLILTTKYRRGVLTKERTQFIRGVISGFTGNYGVELTNLDGEDDHVHILFRAKPTTDLVKFTNTVKGDRPPYPQRVRGRTENRTVGRLVLERLVLPHLDGAGVARCAETVRRTST